MPDTAHPLAFHRFLLRAAGRAPDELVSQARQWLADGRTLDVARALAFASLTGRLPVADEEAALLEEVLGETGLRDRLPRVEGAEIMPYGASPVGPDELAAGGPVPYCLDLTGGDHGAGAPDAVDRALIAAVAGLPAVSGVWRAWRFPAVPTHYPPPKRLYLVQADAGAITVAAALQTVLAEAGESHPLVDVFAAPEELPGHQRTALAYSALLFSAAPATPVEIVPTFDAVDAAGDPGFGDRRPILAEEEAAQVAAYLAAGTPMLAGAERCADVLEPALDTVPMGIRGDGRWLWSEAVTYYVDRYGIAPDPRLLAAIRAAGYVPPPVGAVAVHRSVAVLFAAVLDADPAEHASLD